MLLPSFDLFKNRLSGLALEGFLDAVYSSNHRAHALEFALMLRSDDFLEDPLDHEAEELRGQGFLSSRVNTRWDGQEQGAVSLESCFEGFKRFRGQRN